MEPIAPRKGRRFVSIKIPPMRTFNNFIKQNVATKVRNTKNHLVPEVPQGPKNDYTYGFQKRFRRRNPHVIKPTEEVMDVRWVGNL